MKFNLALFDDQDFNIENFMDSLGGHFNVFSSMDPNDYQSIIQENNIHAFIIDINMPKMSGYELHEKIITHPNYNGCPIIFVSADDSDETQIKSLSTGADFIPKGVYGEELVLRIKNKIKLFFKTTTSLELGNLSIDLKEMKGTINSEVISLTLLELRILSQILRVYPKSLTRTELIGKIWSEESSVKPGTINTHLTNLRPKVDEWDYQIKIREESIVLVKK